ncbi:hypothetical protein P7C70_g2526, partial [Phenoliferia sp. Uapishka_3]
MAANAHQQGLVAYKSGSYEMAADLFSQAITADPTRAAAYHARAKAFEQLGQIQDALRDVREVVRLRPDSYEGFLLGGKLYSQAGKLEKARQLLSTALGKTASEQTAARKVIEKELASVGETIVQAQFSPLSGLPTELFIDIISLSLDAYNSYLGPQRSTTRRNPVVVATHVCRQWRKTLEVAPRLWSSLTLDGSSKPRPKARWWASRAVGLSSPESQISGSGQQWGPGLSKLVVNRTQDIGIQGLSDMLEELEGMGAFRRLEEATFSWLDGAGTTQVHQHQLQRVVTFLRAHATTLRSIKIETHCHLRIHFSLPRFGSTFSALRSLELRSTPAAVTAPDVYIPESLLPPVEDEGEWPPMAITRLVLVGPVWRLRFPDGSIGAPLLAETDCPALTDVEFGSTSPTMTWDIFSCNNLRHLRILRQIDQPTLPAPNLTPSARTLTTLSLDSCPALTTRLMQNAITLSSFLPSLTSLNLNGATIYSELLAHFASDHSPHLIELRLPRTNALPGQTIQLPLFGAVEVLDLSLCRWVTGQTLEETAKRLPKVERLNMTSCSCVSGSSVIGMVRAKRETIPIKELNLTSFELKEKELNWLKANIRNTGFRHSYPPLVDDGRGPRRQA